MPAAKANGTVSPSDMPIMMSLSDSPPRTYVLLRFCAWISRWGHSFTRFFTLLRSALWLKLDLRSFLESCGTAGGSFRFLGTPEQAYLPGLS
jgi:hypothetical protein